MITSVAATRWVSAAPRRPRLRRVSMVNLVVTENLTLNRGHGHQRFHHRRPFAEITTLFARHGLIPSSTAPGAPIMFWVRDR